MQTLPGILTPRLLVALVAVLVVLLTVLFLLHLHLGTMPPFVQSTEGILD